MAAPAEVPQSTRSNGLQLIIAGAPASGKGTQCELLKSLYNVVHLSTGDMLREAAKDENSEVGQTAKNYMESGRLVPDNVIIGVVKERLLKPDCKEKGWLLDGFPRTRAQADALASSGYHPDAFVFLDVPDNLLVERVVGRRTDPDTGKIYHMVTSPPETPEIAARLQQRADDTEEKVKVRLQGFHQNLSPILAFYTNQLIRVDGNQDKKVIFGRIKDRLDMVKRYRVVFVLGGPGSGKGTQCALLVKNFGYTHLSAGDLLREEQNCGSDVGQMIKDFIKEGKIVPAEVTIRLLQQAMERSGQRDFLIDGFPRSFENLEAWFDVMGDKAEIANVLFFDCPESVMEERLLGRGATSGRADDNITSIKKRFSTFISQSVPTMNALRRLGKVHVISAVSPPDVVYSRVERIFRGISLLPPVERTLAIIKPDGIRLGHWPAIEGRMKEEGFFVVASKTETLTEERAKAFYDEHKERPFFEALIKFMTSGPCMALMLERPNAIKQWRMLMGTTDPVKAKEEDPDSIRALMGTDNTENVAHGSDSYKSASRELEFFFPDPLPTEQTLALIKPGTATVHRDEIMCCLASRGFQVVKSLTMTMSEGMAKEFYAEHEGRPFYPKLVSYMSSDEIVALQLQREAAVPAWRALAGPTNSIQAKQQAPNTIRALYGTDGTVNAVHGSDSSASAEREIMFWFPDRWKELETAGENTHAGSTVNGGEQATVAAFMKDSVDPVLAPLLQRLVLARPPDVVEWVIKDLQAHRKRGVGQTGTLK